MEVACRWGCNRRTCSVLMPSAEGSSSPVGMPPSAPCNDKSATPIQSQPHDRSDVPDKSDDTTASVSSSLPDFFDIDWLTDCCDSSIEDLEEFADSLYKEALSLEQSEPQSETLVGSVPECVESDGNEKPADVGCTVPEMSQNDDINLLIKKEKIEEQVELSEPSSPSEYFEPQSEYIVVYPQCITTADSLMNSLSNDSRTGHNFILIEDAVEEVCCTSESDDVSMIMVSSDDSGLSESEGSECISAMSPASLKTDDETISDHGYDSVDSPQSEPDQLKQLFPELW